jgi:hypothetical protein
MTDQKKQLLKVAALGDQSRAAIDAMLPAIQSSVGHMLNVAPDALPIVMRAASDHQLQIIAMLASSALAEAFYRSGVRESEDA